MGAKVFANGMEISGKASDNKSIAAMPEVCMSPPSPPAGPVPIPYPNTAMASNGPPRFWAARADWSPWLPWWTTKVHFQSGLPSPSRESALPTKLGRGCRPSSANRLRQRRSSATSRYLFATDHRCL